MNLNRVLEPEVMDTADEARDYDRMDHSEVNRLFVADLLTEGFDGDDVLDLGTGTALIPIELCRHHPTCRVMAVDLATHMLDLARLNIEAAGLIQRIELHQIDAKHLGFADGMFDAVISNSIIHHIPEPIDCLRQAVRVTRPGGRVFFRDLLRPDSQQQLDALVEAYAGQENDHARQMFAQSLHAALSLQEIRALIESLGFHAAQASATSDRHWTWTALRPTE